MKTKIFFFLFIALTFAEFSQAQTNVTEIAFRNSDGGDDSDPYRMRKVQTSSNNNYLELQLNDDADESFRIYGNSCVGFGCGTYSGNLYHSFDASGNALHIGKLGLGGTASTRLHLIDGTPTGVQSLNSLTKFTLDAGSGGFMEFRSSMDNNTPSGLLFTDNNLGGYVTFKNYPDDKLHVGGYGGISFEVGTDNNVGGKAERVRIDAIGNVGIGTSNPRGKLDVDGAGDIYLADDIITGTTQSAYFPGHIYLAPYSGSNISYLQARRSNDTGTSALRIRTVNAGVVNESMHIEGNGNVGIGTTSPTQKLTVNGTIYGKEVKVDLSVPGPDYVFDEDYKLTPLVDIKSYIDQHKHLPEIPSAKEMEMNGIQLGEMNMLLLKKIEELTLYVIELKKEVETLKKR